MDYLTKLIVYATVHVTLACLLATRVGGPASSVTHLDVPIDYL